MIDVLRGIAAMAVVLHHVRVTFWVGWFAIQESPNSYSFLDQLASWLGIPMRFMGAGVFLFFVISGYCIHRPQAERAVGLPPGRKPVTFGLLKFFTRRFLRIYPPYLAAVAIGAAVLWFSGDWAAGAGRVVASAFMLQNYLPPGGQMSTNPSLWSLPVEMELYFVYPFAWWLGGRVGWGRVLLVTILFSLGAQIAWHQGARWLDASFPRFWAIWCAGAWLAELRCQSRLPPWSEKWAFALVAAIAAACGVEVFSPIEGLSLWFWGVASVLAVMWAAQPHVQGRAGGSCYRLFSWVGGISYSLYLLHFPLFVMAGKWWQDGFGAKPSSIGVGLVAAALIVPLAWAFHVVVEKPSHRLARRLGREGA